jgi:uncharacterized protein (DUF3820 family)
MVIKYNHIELKREENIMDKNNFVPNLVIGVGATSAYFTLRETYLHYFTVHGFPMSEVRSFHHFNLSQDAEEAFEKAKNYSKQMGVPLRNQSAEELRTEMREIQRATAEEMEYRAKIQAEREARWEEERKEREKQKFDLIKQGIMPFGQYIGEKFSDLPMGYVTWFVKTRSEFEPESLIYALSVELEAQVPSMILPDPNPTATIGKEKQRLEMTVTVVRTVVFQQPSFSGYGMDAKCMSIMVEKETKACVVCFSTSFWPEVGKEMKIKATVKEFKDYKGQQQTIVQRIKVL